MARDRRGRDAPDEGALLIRIAPEISAMVRPRTTFAALARTDAGSGWRVGLRRPTACALVLGSAVSLIVSGRLTPRLVAGGALSWSFVPAFEALAFAIGRRRDGA